MANLTLLILILTLCVASTVQRQLVLEDINGKQNLEKDLNIVHYQPEQVHLAFGGMFLINVFY